MKTALRTLAIAASALLAPCASCSPGERRPPSGPPWNVVLVCLDTVRADHLGAYGHARETTPFLDELAARSLLFTDASATAGWTKPSVPSFLTGTYPCQHGVYEGSARAEAGEVTDLLPESALTLAEVFQQHGYRTAAFVHNAQLRLGNGFEQGFERYAEEDWDAREIRWQGLDWIDGLGSQPFFLYLHFLDAHWPYPAPEEFATRFADAARVARFRGGDSRALRDAINDGRQPFTDEDRESLEALYDGALAWLDAELRRFHDGLVLRGLDRNTILCVVADHGEEFGEHGKIGHGHGLWENLLRVPWVLSVPGRAAQRIENPVSLIDLFPTLVSAAGFSVPPGLEGVDRLSAPAERRAIFAEHKAPDRYSQSLRLESAKLLRRFTPPREARAGGEALEFLFPVETGTRWEAELVVEDGELRTTRMKPRSEEVDDPPELKGRIEDLARDGFRIAGIPVRFDERTVRQTEPGTGGPELVNGELVKVRGPLTDGALQAERIKFYAPGEEDALEIRGPVVAIEEAQGAGRVALGGIWIRFTPETELEGAELRPKKRRLERGEIAELLQQGALAAAQRGFALERTLYDLRGDPGELGALAAGGPSDLDGGLDDLGQRLARRRIFGENDRKTLSAEALDDLRDIGYVR